MKCTNCKKPLREGAKFCPACGAKARQHKGRRSVAIVLVIILLLGVITGGLAIGISAAKHFGSSKSMPKINNAEEAIAHAKKMGNELGYKNAMSELTEKVTTEIEGDSYYRLQQNYKGIPVYGKSLVYATNHAGQVTSLTGNVEDIDKTLSLVATVPQEDVIKAINDYIIDGLGFDEIYSLEVSAIDQTALCIFCEPEDHSFILAYDIWVTFSSDTMYCYEVLADAHDCRILSASSTLNNSTATGYRASDTGRQNGFPVKRLDDGRYALIDDEQGLWVYDLQRKNSSLSGIDGNNFVTSDNNIFGDDKLSEANHELGTYLLQNVTKIQKYYQANVGFKAESGYVILCYNDGYYFGRNARGGLYNGFGFVSVGYVTGVDNIDAIAHEYGHVMSNTHMGVSSINMETAILKEGLSDIYGEIAEASILSWEEPDWVMTADNIGIKRNIRDPNLSGNAANTAERSLLTQQPMEYYRSTIISHAAYLMWNGINNNASKKIDTDRLAKLWYRAMLMMPADCDFATCRQLVEWAALSVDGLTEVQRECIAEAFDEVGIQDQTLAPEILINCDRNVRPGGYLNVYNANGDLHPNYTLSISGTYAEHELAYAPTVMTDIGFRYEKTIEVKKAASYWLDLPDGYYTFTVTDSNNPQYTYSFTVSISNQGTEDGIELHTDFKDQLIVKVTETTEPSMPLYDLNNLVSDAYYDYVAKTLYNGEGFYHIPKVNANLPQIEKTNAKMYDDYYSYMQTNVYAVLDEGTPIGEISYIWGVKDQYLSILMRVVWGSDQIFSPYTISLETGEILEDNKLLSAYGLIWQEFIAQCYLPGKTLVNPVPYINSGNGDLCAVCIDDETGHYTLLNITGTSNPFYPWDNSKEEQGITFYDSYRSSQGIVESDPERLSIQPGYYVQDGNELNTLTVHTVSGSSLTFSAWWYRTWDISKATATGVWKSVSFDYTKSNVGASGSITFTEDSVTLTLDKCEHPYVDAGDYHFKLIGRVFTNEQLAQIGAALGVPSNLSVEYKQGEPSYWEGGGFYRTEVEILHNGELIAGASVDSMTGGLAGGILMFDNSTYTAQTERTSYVSESAGEVNIRSGPGTEYPSIGRLRANEEVTIYETRNNASATWGRISDEGWVCLDYITFSDPAYPWEPEEVREKETDQNTALDEHPFEQKYWVIFKEGTRKNRVEMSTVDSNIDRGNLHIIWDHGLYLNNTDGQSKCNQYCLNEENEWLQIGTYNRLSDYASSIIASNLDVYDAQGNLLAGKCAYSDVDWSCVIP